MTYSQACDLLGFTTPKSPTENAQLAKSRLSVLPRTAPLREKVACQIIIDYATK